jgi:cytidyltransferase-like protein
MYSEDRLGAWRRYRDTEGAQLPWVRASELRHLPLAGPVVLINGAFDLLHAGHMRLIFAARAQGATLVVALDTDEKVRREKGAARPFQSFAERSAALNYMPVDLIVPVGTRRDMDQVVAACHLRVQSDEYLGRPSRYPSVPKLFVRNSRTHTTALAERIAQKVGPQ